MNHLLNFTFPERQIPSTDSVPRRKLVTSARSMVFNKEKYVNAK
jgi:hypothetical protein